MANAPTYKSLLNRFSACPTGLQAYFSDLPTLIQSNFFEVSLAYLFLRTELAQNRTLYCGVVKLHHAHTSIASSGINAQHLTRGGFTDLYRNVFGEPLPNTISEKLKVAEKTRDRVVHGKNVGAPELREAIWDVLEYAEKMNAHLKSKAGFEPFGDLRGFKGRGVPLDKSTSRWLLKGMGFAIR